MVRCLWSRLWNNVRVREWVSTLDQGHVPDASSSVRNLLRHAVADTLGSHVVAAVDLDNCVNKTELDHVVLSKLDALCQRRLETREPVQYIVGSWDFLWLDDFLIRPPVLVPRPETEELVEKILETHLDDVVEITRTRPFHFLEVGCGSGVVSIALLKRMQEQCNCASPRPRFPVLATAIDCSAEAVALAKDNAALFGVDNVLQLHVCPIERFRSYHRAWGAEDGLALLHHHNTRTGFDLLVSNPPYIPTSELEGLMPEVSAWEDAGALDGGPDGLRVVRQILSAALGHSGCLRSGANIWLEVDTQHPAMIKAEIAESPHVHFVSSLDDYTDRPRFVRLRIS